MKKSLLAVLIAGILLISAGAFAGTITISQIPDVIVVNDGNPGGARGDQTFQFSEAFAFADKVSVTGGTSSEPISLWYIVTGEAGAIDAETVVTIEGAAHPTAVDGNGETAETLLGAVTALDADSPEAVLAVEYAGLTTYSASTDYLKQIKVIGRSGDTNPGSSAIFQIDAEWSDAGGTNIDRFSGQYTEIANDDFATGDDGWVYAAVLGTTASDSTGGELEITYNAIDSYSYWQRPFAHSNPLPAYLVDTLYLVEADVTTSVTSTTVGDINDFRLFISDEASAALNILLINSQFSDGGANYISPSASGVTYQWPVEPNVLSGNTNRPLVQFEGYNIAAAGRSDRVGTSVAMQAFRLYTADGVDATAAGTAVVTMATSTDFATGAGSAYGWSFEAGTSANNVGITGVSSGGTLTLAMATAPAAGQYAYGSWTTSIFNTPTSPVTFAGDTLYRLTYKITSTAIAAGENHIVPVVRVNTGDFHLNTGVGVYPGFGANKVLTTSVATTPDVDLWFYYQGATRTDGGTWSEDVVFPSFDGQVPGPILVPNGNTLTLSEIAITEHGALP